MLYLTVPGSVLSETPLPSRRRKTELNLKKFHNTRGALPGRSFYPGESDEAACGIPFRKSFICEWLSEKPF
jgi:hypothetical protein